MAAKCFKGQISLTSTRPTSADVTARDALFTAPTGLTADISNGKVALNWTAVTGAADVLSYNVKRATIDGGNFTRPLPRTWESLSALPIQNVSNGTTYYYIVSAVNSPGSSVNSIAVSVVPQTYYQVNSGGGAASPFMADAFFSGGTAGSTSATIDTSGMTNPMPPQAVYQTER